MPQSVAPAAVFTQNKETHRRYFLVPVLSVAVKGVTPPLFFVDSRLSSIAARGSSGLSDVDTGAGKRASERLVDLAKLVITKMVERARDDEGQKCRALFGGEGGE